MEMKLECARSYASPENAEKAVAKAGLSDLRYIIYRRPDGRCFPLFMMAQGERNAIQMGIHFRFNVIG